MYAEYSHGPSVFYSLTDPFQGRSRTIGTGVTLQPNLRFSQRIDVRTVDFDNAASREQVYNVHIVNTRATDQFNKYFLVRAVVQYDSSTRRVLTDASASYELVAGTVFHAGYGSLYERRSGDGNSFVPIELGQKYVSMNRGLFFKASYMHRF